MGTTKRDVFTAGEGWWEVYFPLQPVPASRPRVGRFGTYYPKRYQTWKTEAASFLKPYWNDADPVFDPVFVIVRSVVKLPKTTKREHPKPDVDNFAKAPLDVITGSQLVWNDDDQVVLLVTDKRYASPGEEPYTFVRAALDESVLFSRGGNDVYDLPLTERISLEEIKNAETS